MIFQTLGLLLIFLFLTLISFYPLGYLILGKNTKKLEGHEIISLSFAISIVVFVLLYVFLFFIKTPFLLVFILLGVNLTSFIKYKFNLLVPWKSILKNKILLGIIFLGILVEGFIIFPSGYPYKEGLLFWSSQGFDGLWYISLIEAVSKGIPPHTPVFSGINLHNYHYLVDVLMGGYYRIFNFFSPIDLYFRFFPVFLSFLLGLSIFSLMNRWKNKAVGYWALFFTYFVGSFGFIVTYLQSGNFFGGETAFWASQLNTVVANPPHASAIILFCSFLLSFLLFTRTEKKIWFYISVLIGSMVAGFKVSGGAILLAGLGMFSFIQILRERKFGTILLFLILLVTNFATLQMISPDATSLLIFEPWWFIRTMVVDKLGLIDWELRRQTYLWVGKFTSYLRVIQLEVTALLIFIAGNLGVRILSFPVIIGNLVNFKKKLLNSPMDIFLITSGFVGFIFPMLFLQRGVAWVSIQFMQYVLLITGFYGAVFTYSVLKKMRHLVLKIVFIVVLFSLSVPTVIGNYIEFYGSPPNALISNNEISALNYLKENSNNDDIVLTPSYNKYAKNDYKKNPLPIYTWFGTAYVSAMTERSTFLNCEEQLQIMGYDVETRLKEVEIFFTGNDTDFNNNFLMSNKITYIYVPTPRKYSLNEEDNNLTKVFSNDEVNIYKVNSYEK